MIVYDGFQIFSLITIAVMIIIYLLFSIIRRVAELRKNREKRINEKLQEKYDKEENKNAETS